LCCIEKHSPKFLKLKKQLEDENQSQARDPSRNQR